MIAENMKRIILQKELKCLVLSSDFVLTALMVTLSLFLFVIPRFAELFAGSQVQLPWLTRILFFLSATLNEYIYLIFLPVIFIVFTFFLPHSFSYAIKKSFLYYFRKLPFINTFIQKILLARFSRHLSMTFSAGISILDALKLLTQNAAYPEFSHSIFHLRSKIQSGLQLHQAMQSITHFQIS